MMAARSRPLPGFSVLAVFEDLHGGPQYFSAPLVKKSSPPAESNFFLDGEREHIGPYWKLEVTGELSSK